MVSYETRLERLGYLPACARRIVSDYVKNGKVHDLDEYISFKESVNRSISEHVTEVIG
ncbi:hypothetical protein [Agathobaculum desmolans]|uniref:hypothetical protein n=1 Tax=Agathobaculum desmolans TaxID=39484 RepID=UPI000A96A7A8|nr:hypothetical protein [Agathobaculum desmolans]